MFYKINEVNAQAIEYKDEISNLELLGIKKFLEVIFKGKAKKMFDRSVYVSEPGQLDFMDLLGKSYQFIIKDSDEDYHNVRLVKVSVNGSLFLITHEDITIKVELGSITH